MPRSENTSSDDASFENVSSPQIVGIGEILWDMLPAGRRIGGAPANFAFHANARGASATVVSSVGNDALGHEIIESMTAWNLDSRYIAVQDAYPTGTVQVRVDADGIPTYEIKEEVAWDHIAWSRELEALAASVRAVCFGTLGQRAPESRATLRRFLETTQASCLRVCDINLRQSYFDADVLRDSLRRATILKLNHEELPVVARLLGLNAAPETTETMLAEIRAGFDLDLVALTRGGAGSLLLTTGGLSDHPGCPVKVVDTVGAGDAFTAALVVGLLRGDALDTINVDANRAAAEVCSHAGAIPGVKGGDAAEGKTV
jgi:fructokinase